MNKNTQTEPQYTKIYQKILKRNKKYQNVENTQKYTKKPRNWTRYEPVMNLLQGCEMRDNPW